MLDALTPDQVFMSCGHEEGRPGGRPPSAARPRRPLRGNADSRGQSIFETAATALLAAAAGLFWGCAEDPAVPSFRVQRQDLTRYLTTNGRVEPLEDYPISAAMGGRISATPVAKGARVVRGTVVAAMEDDDARLQWEQAKARLAGAEAELAQADRGGRAAETADIEARLEAARREENRAREEAASIERLAGRQAASRAALRQARAALSARETDREILEKRWGLRVDPEQRRQAAALVSEAAAAARSAERRLQEFVMRSPANGILYTLSVRPGDYVERGAVIARVGQLDAARIVVFVDEPELGRVKRGAAVILSADAYPDQRWEGRVDRLPTRIVLLDARRVGEVLCTVDNPEGLLIPDLTVSARVESGGVRDALVVPREALAQKDGETYLWLLDDGRTARKQAVQVGLRTESRAEVRSGIDEGDEVLLPGGLALQPGQKVRAGP